MSCKIPNITQKNRWLRNRMDSSVLPMMLCMRQLGWKRNLAKACPEKPFWVKKAQEMSCKMPNITQKNLWLRNRMDCDMLPMMLCLHQLGWKRNLAKACPEKPFWVKKAQERSHKGYKMPKSAHKKVSKWKRLRKCHARCQTSHNKVYDCVTGWILACYRLCFACAN